jgi:hypothetical protein
MTNNSKQSPADIPFDIHAQSISLVKNKYQQLQRLMKLPMNEYYFPTVTVNKDCQCNQQCATCVAPVAVCLLPCSVGHAHYILCPYISSNNF